MSTIVGWLLPALHIFLEGKVLKCSQLVRFGSSFHFSPSQKIQKGPLLPLLEIPEFCVSSNCRPAFVPFSTRRRGDHWSHFLEFLLLLLVWLPTLPKLPTLPTLPRPNGFIVLLELLYWLLVTSSNLFVRHRKLFTYIIRFFVFY